MSQSVKVAPSESIYGGVTTTRARVISLPMTTVKLAWRNMWRNWRRTAIALVAIVLGLLLLLFMDGLIKGSDQAIFGNAVRLYGGNIQVHAPGFREKANRLPLRPLENADDIVLTARSRPEVKLAAKRISTGGMVSSREGAYPVSITALEPDVEAPHSFQAEHLVEGRFLVPEDEDAIFIGQGLADALDVGVGDRVTLLGRSVNELMRQRTMTIVGIYDLGMPEIEKGAVFMTLPEAQTLYGLRDQATEVTIVLHELNQEKGVLSSLQESFPGQEVDSWETLRPEMRQTMDLKGTVTTFFSFVVLLIASIGVLNLMLMAAFERTREMGVLAALGMKGRQIMALFMLEGGLIGVVGAVIGCGLGLALLLVLGQGGIDFSFASSAGGEMVALMGDRIYPSISVLDAVRYGATVAFITALAALIPAWQSARREPADALHHI